MAVFADTAYWIARNNSRDQWHQSSLDAFNRLGPDERIVTTEEVLTEFLTGMSKSGAYMRQQAVDVVRSIYESPSVDVIAQSRQTFFDGLHRYARRLDKAYSLQDCVSMNAMERMGIDGALTNDRRFEQEGFTMLMR